MKYVFFAIGAVLVIMCFLRSEAGGPVGGEDEFWTQTLIYAAISVLFFLAAIMLHSIQLLARKT